MTINLFSQKKNYDTIHISKVHVAMVYKSCFKHNIHEEEEELYIGKKICQRRDSRGNLSALILRPND